MIQHGDALEGDYSQLIRGIQSNDLLEKIPLQTLLLSLADTSSGFEGLAAEINRVNTEFRRYAQKVAYANSYEEKVWARYLKDKGQDVPDGSVQEYINSRAYRKDAKGMAKFCADKNIKKMKFNQKYFEYHINEQIKQQEEKNVSQKEYCEKNNLNETSFSKFRSKLFSKPINSISAEKLRRFCFNPYTQSITFMELLFIHNYLEVYRSHETLERLSLFESTSDIGRYLVEKPMQIVIPFRWTNDFNFDTISYLDSQGYFYLLAGNVNPKKLVTPYEVKKINKEFEANWTEERRRTHLSKYYQSQYKKFIPVLKQSNQVLISIGSCYGSIFSNVMIQEMSGLNRGSSRGGDKKYNSAFNNEVNRDSPFYMILAANDKLNFNSGFIVCLSQMNYLNEDKNPNYTPTYNELTESLSFDLPDIKTKTLSMKQLLQYEAPRSSIETSERKRGFYLPFVKDESRRLFISNENGTNYALVICKAIDDNTVHINVSGAFAAGTYAACIALAERRIKFDSKRRWQAKKHQTPALRAKHNQQISDEADADEVTLTVEDTVPLFIAVVKCEIKIHKHGAEKLDPSTLEVDPEDSYYVYPHKRADGTIQWIYD